MSLRPVTHITAVAALILLAVGNIAHAEQKYAGQIHSVSPSQIVLMISTELMTFSLDENTAVTLNGKTVKAKDLKSGDEASLQAEKGDDSVLRALSVTATRPATAASRKR